jgi:hypothetical protein
MGRFEVPHHVRCFVGCVITLFALQQSGIMLSFFVRTQIPDQITTNFAFLFDFIEGFVWLRFNSRFALAFEFTEIIEYLNSE